MSIVQELDRVRLIREVDGWPAGTEGFAVVASGGRLAIERPDDDAADWIYAGEGDVEVTWRDGVGSVSPPLRAGKAAA